jgi:two-component system alkaline phosphatase synthesis response regulator PhoP
MKILLAEDDLNVSVITQLCLEKIGGHEVVVTYDGEEALSRALNENFDLIILDGMMPKLGGIQVATRLRTQAAEDESVNSEIPVIFLSAKSEEREVAEFRRLGCGYIAKPFDPQLICQKIDELLKEYHRSHAA